MSDIEQGSLRYLLGRTRVAQWQEFLQVLADELNTQMPAPELRVFFRALGRRLASRLPLMPSRHLAELEQRIDEQVRTLGWGWVRLHDLGDGLELLHACTPLRQAFGEASVDWTGGLLEGLHGAWMKQAGAGDALELRQTGAIEVPFDTFRFRLAHPSLLV